MEGNAGEDQVRAPVLWSLVAVGGFNGSRAPDTDQAIGQK